MPDTFLPENTKKALDEINKLASLIDNYDFYLAGGTALAFRLKYRISYDLDFFTAKSFDPQEVLNVLKEKLVVSDTQVSAGTLKFIAFDTNFSFFNYPYNILAPYESYKNIKLANILDIALMKVTAISDRGL